MNHKIKDIIQFPGVASLLLLLSLCLFGLVASSRSAIVAANFLATIVGTGILIRQLSTAEQKHKEQLRAIKTCMPHGLLDVWKAFDHPNGSTVIEDANGAVVATFEGGSLAAQVCAMRNHLNDRYVSLLKGEKSSESQFD